MSLCDLLSMFAFKVHASSCSSDKHLSFPFRCRWLQSHRPLAFSPAPGRRAAIAPLRGGTTPESLVFRFVLRSERGIEASRSPPAWELCPGFTGTTVDSRLTSLKNVSVGSYRCWSCMVVYPKCGVRGGSRPKGGRIRGCQGRTSRKPTLTSACITSQHCVDHSYGPNLTRYVAN